MNDLEERIADATRAVANHHADERECKRVGLLHAAAFYRENAQACAAEVARLVAQRTPEAVAHMERERGLP